MGDRRRRGLIPIFICVICLLIINLVLNEAAVIADGSLPNAPEKVTRQPPLAELVQQNRTPMYEPTKHMTVVEDWTESYTRPNLHQSPFAMEIATAKDTPFNRGWGLLYTLSIMAATHSRNADHIPSNPTSFKKVFKNSLTPNEENVVSKIVSKRFLNARFLPRTNPELYTEEATQPRPTNTYLDLNVNAISADSLVTKGVKWDGVVFNSATDVLSDPRVEGCPSTCLCKREANGVNVRCNSHLWKNVPPLPQDVHRFVWESPKTPVVIQNDSFSGTYKQLEEIELNYAEIEHIGGRAFEAISNLKRIYFRDNKLKSLPKDLFRRNTQIHFISIRDNGFESIPHASLCKAQNLETFTFQQSLVKTVDFPPCYTRMVQLRGLELSKNPISKLASEDFYNLRNSPLRDLRMNGCNISRLPENLFQYVPGLAYISLSKNKLTHLPPLIFQNMTNLKVLIFSDNKILKFESVWLVNNLVTLNIQNNGLKSIAPRRNESLPSFRQLHLDKNRLKILKNYTFTPLGIEYVELLTLDQCGLKVIEAHAFYGLRHLRSLSLSYNIMNAEMVSTALHGLSTSPLEKMYLKGLKLHNLNNETFAPLGISNITDLRLDGCGIKILRTGVFDNLPHLRMLSLSNNMITEVQMNAFSPLSHLEGLAFRGNLLNECLNVKTAGLSPSVLHIDMHDNKIGQVTQACTRGLDNLIKYDLYGNTLKKIGAESFIRTNISNLMLGKNQISRLANDSFTNMSNLKTLNLVANTIQLVETGCFDGLYALKFLKLSHNPLLGRQILQLATAFKNLHSLKELICDTCGIEDLPTDIFTNMRNLDRLNIHNNYIVTWHPDLFIHQQKLKTLYLEKNRIVTLNRDMFQYLPNLQEIHLYGNPFACTCDIKWFRSWITDGSIFAYIDISKDDIYRCASPSDVKGISLLEVDLSFSKCGPIEAVIGGAVSGIVFVLILITAGLSYRYRWYIRYGYFLLQRRMRQRRNEIGNSVEFTYDAFVSYNHGDQQWVIERLLPALEYRGGVHLCLHDRDWLAGCLIADNIIESIENSRKTVLVLSNNFAQSEWCQLEMSMAQHKLLTSRKDVLVLVMKENIDDVHMSRNLRYLISTQTYLAWDDNDDEKQRLFWKALIKAIKADVTSEDMISYL